MKFASNPDRARAVAIPVFARHWARLLVPVLAVALTPASATRAQDEDGGRVDLVLSGMTYVASVGSTNDVVLDAESAHVPSPGDQAHLEGVRARFGTKAPGGPTSGGSGGLDFVCDRGVFDLQTRDFVAEGNIYGTTHDGRRFETDALRYNHEAGLVSTDHPVKIRDEAGTYRGGGFDYYVREDRFRLRGGARVVQEAP